MRTQRTKLSLASCLRIGLSPRHWFSSQRIWDLNRLWLSVTPLVIWNHVSANSISWFYKPIQQHIHWNHETKFVTYCERFHDLVLILTTSRNLSFMNRITILFHKERYVMYKILITAPHRFQSISLIQPWTMHVVIACISSSMWIKTMYVVIACTPKIWEIAHSNYIEFVLLDSMQNNQRPKKKWHWLLPALKYVK